MAGDRRRVPVATTTTSWIFMTVLVFSTTVTAIDTISAYIEITVVMAVMASATIPVIIVVATIMITTMLIWPPMGIIVVGIVRSIPG